MRHGGHHNQRRVVLSLLALESWIALAAAVAVARAEAFLGQPGAGWTILELGGMLCFYAVAILRLARLRDRRWEASLRYGLMFGVLSGAVEVTSILLENLLPAGLHFARLSIGLMLLTFLIWSSAAVWIQRRIAAWTAGFVAAMVAAGTCMLIGVAAGSAVELFLRPPDPSVVATWAEFRRSGWQDAASFAVQNTLDSGFTHLLLAPLVACVFAAAAMSVMRLASRARTSVVRRIR